MTTRSTPITALIMMGMIILPVVLTKRKNSPDRRTGKKKFFQVPPSPGEVSELWEGGMTALGGALDLSPGVRGGSGPSAGTAGGGFLPLSVFEVLMVCFLRVGSQQLWHAVELPDLRWSPPTSRSPRRRGIKCAMHQWVNGVQLVPGVVGRCVVQVLLGAPKVLSMSRQGLQWQCLSLVCLTAAQGNFPDGV